MKRLRFVALCGAFALALLCFQTTVTAQTRVGPFDITGFYQYTINPTTRPNPNNAGLARGKPNFLLMRQLLDLSIYGRLSENWSVYFEPRFFHDITKSASPQLPQYGFLILRW